MAETVHLYLRSQAEAKRILRRFKGRKLSALSRKQLQTVIVAMSVLLPPSFNSSPYFDIEFEAESAK